MEIGEIKKGDPEAMATEIFGITCSSLIYRLKTGKEINIQTLYQEFSNDVINGIISR